MERKLEEEVLLYENPAVSRLVRVDGGRVCVIDVDLHCYIHD